VIERYNKTKEQQQQPAVNANLEVKVYRYVQTSDDVLTSPNGFYVK